MKLVRVAVVARAYPKVLETFVKRHTEHLFDGNTVIVARYFTSVIERPDESLALEVEGKTDSFFSRLVRQTINVVLGQPPNAIRGEARKRLEAFLVEQKVDCILCEFGNLAGIVYPCAKRLGLPLFVYFRGHDATSAIRLWHGSRSLACVFPYLSSVFAVSQFLLDELKASGFDHSYKYVLPSGVDTAKFRPSTKSSCEILFAGRLVEKKNPLIAVKAVALLVKDFPYINLKVIGDGPLLQEALGLAQEIGVANNVDFAGAATHEEVRLALSNAAMLVQPSGYSRRGDAEGLPSVVQEAMASGCVVVATAHAGVPEVVDHGTNGWLVRENTPEAFAEAIRYLILHSDERARMAANARQTAVESLDCWALQARLEEIIQSHVK